MAKIYTLTLLFWIPFFALGQTKVTGKVMDENGNPIAFANVIFKNTTTGTSTDNNGNFNLKSDKNYNILEVSFIGYTTKEIRLKSHYETDLQIVLIEGEELSEVTIVGRPTKHLSKKENPAYKILKNIWKNKHKNGLKQANYYQYQRYISTELGLNQLDSTFLKTALQSDYEEIRKILSEKKFKQYFSMPMFLQEEVENVYGNNLTGAKRVDMEAERHQGVVQTGFGLERISKVIQEFDIYDNSFLILERPFVSPISEYGYGVYSYVLNDSIERNGQKFYTIYFFPRQEQDLVFQGSFVVGDRNYAIESIQMFTTKNTNINLTRNLSFEKHFKIVNDSIFLPEKDIYEGDFSLLSKSDEEKGMYVRKTVSYDNYQLNNPKTDDFYKENIERYKANQFTKEAPYWANFTNDEQTLKTKKLINDVGSNAKIKSISDVIDFLSTGYLPFNRFLQFGSVWNFYSPNDVEGSRFRLGFRSFKTTEDRFRTYFYGAYGLGDKKFKYGINAKYLLFQKPRVIVGGELRRDNLQLGGILQTNDINLRFRNPSVTWFERGDNYYLTQVQKIQSFINIGLLKSNLNFTLLANYQQQKAADSNAFSIAYRDDNGQIHSSYSDANLGLSITYTPGRRVYGYGVEQGFGDNTHPLYRLKFTQGFSGIRNSAFDYSKIEATINYPVAVWSLGLLNPTIEMGKTFGKVPLPLLSPTPTSQSYSVVGRTFSLLDYYDFVTDTYANLYLEHHFNGLIFNRLPLLKKTKWRSLIFAKAAYGTISKTNQDISLSNVIYNAPNERLYWEYGFGIENIGFGNLRFIRVDFIWRNDFNDVNGVRNPRFGIRLGLVPIF